MIRWMISTRQLKRFTYCHMREMGILTGKLGMEETPYIQSIAPNLRTIGAIRYGPPKSTMEAIHSEQQQTKELLNGAESERDRLLAEASVPVVWGTQPRVRYLISLVATTGLVALTLELVVGPMGWVEYGLISTGSVLIAALGTMQPSLLERFRQWHRLSRAGREVKRARRKLNKLNRLEHGEIRRQKLIADYVEEYEPVVRFIFSDAKERGKTLALISKKPREQTPTPVTTELPGLKPHSTKTDQQKTPSGSLQGGIP